LKAEGYDVATARTASEARTQLETAKPDLLLLDVIMPGEDGFELSEALSQNEEFADMPIVLVTSVADNPGRMMRAFQENHGCSVADVVPKNQVDSLLISTVQAALGEE